MFHFPMLSPGTVPALDASIAQLADDIVATRIRLATLRATKGKQERARMVLKTALNSQLRSAVSDGSVAGAQVALDKGADPTTTWGPEMNKISVLISAVKYHWLQVVRLLLDRGADPNQTYDGFVRAPGIRGWGHAQLVSAGSGCRGDPIRCAGALNSRRGCMFGHADRVFPSFSSFCLFVHGVSVW